MTEMFRLTDEFRNAASAAREAAPADRSIYASSIAFGINPIFGGLVEKSYVDSTAKFLHPETRDPAGKFLETEISAEMIEEMLRALVEVGALSADAKDRIQDQLDKWVAGLGQYELLPEYPQESEQDIAVNLLVDTVRNAEDPFAEAGRWITKVTNGITEVLKEG